MNLLAQAEWYTWASHPWLNEHASYHRMVYEDRSRLLWQNDSKDLISGLIQRFRESERSRLVIRFLYADNQDTTLTYLSQYVATLGWQLWYYDNHQPNTTPFSYVTVSLNNNHRMVDSRALENLTLKNRQYIDRLLWEMDLFEEYNLKKLEDFRRKGFTLTRSMGAWELVSLWWETFGWSKEACEDVLGKKGDDFVIGVRNPDEELVASILYSHQQHTLSNIEKIHHGELTEASTLDRYRGNGIMWILALALHVRAMQNWVMNIYGEYRALWSDVQGAIQSLRFALESGVHFSSWDLLVNHVDVPDVPDPHNRDLSIPWYGDQAYQLKSFMLWALDPKRITPRIQEAYSQAIS